MERDDDTAGRPPVEQRMGEAAGAREAGRLAEAAQHAIQGEDRPDEEIAADGPAHGETRGAAGSEGSAARRG